MEKRLPAILENKPELAAALEDGDFDVEIDEELIIDVGKLAQMHDVVRIHLPVGTEVEEYHTPNGKELIIQKSRDFVGN